MASVTSREIGYRELRREAVLDPANLRVRDVDGAGDVDLAQAARQASAAELGPKCRVEAARKDGGLVQLAHAVRHGADVERVTLRRG